MSWPARRPPSTRAIAPGHTGRSTSIGSASATCGPEAGSLSLERNGFALLRRPTTVRDFADPDQIERVYRPEIDAIVKELTGASFVICFGEIVRTDAPGGSDGRLPAYGAHVDYGERDDPAIRPGHIGARRGGTPAQRALRPDEFMAADHHRRTHPARCLRCLDGLGGRPQRQRGPRRGSTIRNAARCGASISNIARTIAGTTCRAWNRTSCSPSSCSIPTGRASNGPATPRFDDPTSLPDAKPRLSVEARTISFFE